MGGTAASFDTSEAVRFVRTRTAVAPTVALVLGSGLGSLAENASWDVAFPTEEIPGLPRSTVAGHMGRLSLGRWGGRAIVVAQGRAHLYEGYSAEEVTRVVRMFAALGVKSLLLTNAAGGISAGMNPGTLVLIEDQVNLQWRAPGRKDNPFQNPRGIFARPTYSQELNALVVAAATEAGVRLERGVLGVALGPSYETPAEIRMLERMGADVVCMSTAAEVAAANEVGLAVTCVSCVTNWAAGKSTKRLSHQDVTSGVASAAPALRALFERLLPALD